MKVWHCTVLLLVTVWGCSTAIVDQGPGAWGNAGRASGGAGGDTIEPPGGSDSNGGRAAAGASGAAEAGVGGTSGEGGDASGAGGDANCDFGARQAPETCLGAVEAVFEPGVGATCASLGSSATLEQLVGAWVYSPSWDVDETLELATDGTASYSSFTHISPELRDQSLSRAIGTFELFETSIEFKVSDWTLEYFTTHSIRTHEAVSEMHHLWYRYDAASDTLNLAECGSPIGSYKRQ